MLISTCGHVTWCSFSNLISMKSSNKTRQDHETRINVFHTPNTASQVMSNKNKNKIWIHPLPLLQYGPNPWHFCLYPGSRTYCVLRMGRRCSRHSFAFQIKMVFISGGNSPSVCTNVVLSMWRQKDWHMCFHVTPAVSTENSKTITTVVNNASQNEGHATSRVPTAVDQQNSMNFPWFFQVFKVFSRYFFYLF